MSLQPKHLNYIGSKHTLLDWLSSSILKSTGWSSFQGKRIADLFAGTGVVSFYFRNQGAILYSNDIEPCSYTVTKAMTECIYTPECLQFLEQMNKAIQENHHKDTAGFITKHYSPFNGCERMFFTVENAKRIDYIRTQIETSVISEHDKSFLLASLLVSADAVANCASVYGAYLKAFKTTAQKQFVLIPIHTVTVPVPTESKTTNCNILTMETIQAELAYLDPPYNERQYSKNYFPLSVLALSPEEQEKQVLKGKTGIPSSCFSSPFCSKKTVKSAFTTVLDKLSCQWIFISYSSESLLDKDTMIDLLKQYGTVTVLERPYKKFKSQEGVKKKEVKEYLFSLERA